jgi:hypothetical protein
VIDDGARDAEDLLGRLAFAEDDLGHALTERAMMIDHGVAEIAVGEVAQLAERRVDVDFACAHRVEQRAQLHRVHGR